MALSEGFSAGRQGAAPIIKHATVPVKFHNGEPVIEDEAHFSRVLEAFAARKAAAVVHVRP